MKPARHTFRWTPEADAILIRMRNARATWDAIETALGCGKKSVRNHASELRAAGVDIWKPLPRYDSQKTTENVETVRRAILAGQSYSAAASMVRITRNTAVKWAQEMGLKFTAEGTPAATVPDLPPDLPPQQPEMQPPPITRGVSGNEVIPAGHPWSWGAVVEPWEPFLERLYQVGGAVGPAPQ